MSRSRRSAKRVRLVSFETDGSGATVREGGLLGPEAAAQWRATQEHRRGISAQLSDQRASRSTSPQPGNASPTASWDGDNVRMGLEDLENEHLEAAAASQELVDAFILLNRTDRFRNSSSHNWGARRARARYNWLSQLEPLVDSYLSFIHRAPTSGAPEPVLYPQHGVPAEDLRTHPRACIHLVDISGVYRVPLSAFSARPQLNAALLEHGYLGATPVRPAIAFSIRTLLLFGRLRIRARTGKHNFARVLCDLHNITFTRSFRNRLSDAVDAIATIQRRVDQLVAAELGRGESWRMTDACPACAYQCVGEPSLAFARQFALDGNNSMKRFIKSGSALDNAFPFRYFLTRDEVDLCKNEVRGQHTRAAATADPAAEIDAAGGREGECSERWRNARPESEKTASWEELDETGIFVCVCRHGFVVIATDMWRSGELAKYPLSIIKTLIDKFGCEGKLEVGYDIGCAHASTAANASFGQRVQDIVRFVVGSFHGHAHNRLCQLRFHPRYVIGSGREDFEGCERLFSVNNFIASLVRHATRYHRHELIEASFAAWDADKYASIGSLLHGKLLDAKKKISEHASDEDQRRANPQYTDDFFIALLADEREYLAGHAAVPQAALDEQLAEEYSAALRRWWSACASRDALGAPFVNHGAAQGNVDVRKWLAVQRKVQSSEADLQRYEERLGIEAHERWTTDSPAYIDAVAAKKLRTYNDALDALERGVADRLAVLEKLNKRETGYKLRREIAKNATRRGSALATALQKYNDAARALDPPRQTLTHEEVFNIAFLADFPVLRPDVADRPWAQRAIRQLTTAWSETARAREELARIRVECARVRAWIRDEEPLLDAHVRRLEDSTLLRNRLLAKELDVRAQLRYHEHSTILHDLAQLDRADGFEEARGPGLRPLQHPELARAIRPALRVARAPLTTAILDGLERTPQLPSNVDGGYDSESSHAGSILDEVQGEDMDGFFSAVHEIVS